MYLLRTFPFSINFRHEKDYEGSNADEKEKAASIGSIAIVIPL